MSLTLRMLCRRGPPARAFGVPCQRRPLVQTPGCAPSCERLPRRLFNSTVNARSASDTTASGSSLKPYYVTTPIFYVNADPHIGHLYSDVIADVLARYHGYMNSGFSAYDGNGIPISTNAEGAQARFSQKPPVSPIFSTGTDEHGLKVQKVAEASGEDPRALCDRISQRFRHLANAANVDFSTFIRTTDADHAVAVEHLWRTLRERGHIYQGSHEGWYAVSDEAFYPETQVRKVVVDGQEQMQSIETGAKVEWSQEVNYKFRLSAFQQPLIDWLRANPTAIQPAQRHAQVLQEIESGLSDLSISRPRSRLTWGIPVPDDADHTIYVWVDALTNYLTVTGYPAWAKDAKDPSTQTSVVKRSAWPADVHVVGKDILRFHAIYWPAMLLAAGLPLPKTIVAHSHWTMNRAKMSKSRGNVANPFEAMDMFGVDTLRFFLMRVGGNLGVDSDYNPAVLVEFHRKYLQGQLGNLVSRISAPKIHASLADSPRDEDGILIRPSAEDVRAVLDDETYALCERLEDELKQLPGKVDELMQAFELAKVLELVLETAVAKANELVQRIEPWNAATPVAAVREAVILTTETLRIAALLLHPFMPTKMSQLLDALLIPQNLRTSPKDLVRQDENGRLVSHACWRDPAQPKVEPLFPKIQPDPMSKA